MNLPPLGLDVSKLTFNACLVRAVGKLRHKVFPNNPDGFSQLSDWLSKQGVKQVHACLEATGAYGDSLAAHLHGQDHTVSIVNPAAIKAYRVFVSPSLEIPSGVKLNMRRIIQGRLLFVIRRFNAVASMP